MWNIIHVDKYDDLDDGPLANSLGMEIQRQQLLSKARGKTLEVGVGTGINLKYYDFSNIDFFEGVDLSGRMLDYARKKSPKSMSGNINFTVANVENLPFPDDSFDTVVDTFSMCVYPDPDKALSEMKRVLKKNGRLLLLEHTRSSVPLLGTYQDITASPVASLGKGCFWNQNVEEMIQKQQLDIVDREEYLSGLITRYQLTKSHSIE